MSQAPGLKIALKRGALVAAANWPLVAVQFVTDTVLKLMVAVPTVGGIVLVVLALDAEVEGLLTGDLQTMISAVISALWENPAALAAFGLAFLVSVVGASALAAVVKAGTVALMADAEEKAGPVERPPVRLEMLKRANRTGIEPFLGECRRLWKRYLRLGGCLLLAYAATAAIYGPVVIGSYALVNNVGTLVGWTVLAVVGTSALVVWLTAINLFYLLTQMVIAVEDVGVRKAARLVSVFLRDCLRHIVGIVGVVLLLVVAGFVASMLGTFGLGLISWVPIVALAVMPLQIAAWLLRGFVFQYLALTALGAYLTQYRFHRRGAPLTAVPGQRFA
jgi:hypothetical protein